MPSGRILSILFLALLVPASAVSDDFGRIKAELKGRTLLIRGFYRDNQLAYTAGGDIIGPHEVGSWTDSKIRIKAVKMSPRGLEIRGPRVITKLDNDGKFLESVPKHPETIKIQVEAPPGGLDRTQLEPLIRKILVIDSDPRSEDFPPYWRDFFSGKIAQSRDASGELNYKRKGYEAAQNNPDAPLYVTAEGEAVFRVSKDMEAPRIVSQIDPEFSESARDAKYAGSTIISIEIDKAGSPRNPQIVRPIGFGLDHKAVEAVKLWKFTPARRKGEPVVVLSMVEIDFRLY